MHATSAVIVRREAADIPVILDCVRENGGVADRHPLDESVRVADDGTASGSGNGHVAPSELLERTPAVHDARRDGLFSVFTLVGIAALFGLVAIGLGVWAFADRDRRETRVTVFREPPSLQQTLSVLTSKGAQRIPLARSVGRIVLVVTPQGRAVLALDGLGAAPSGRSYQAWVTPPGASTPRSAGVFTGRERAVALSRVVVPGAVVAVTLEQRGGAKSLGRTPTLLAERP